MLLETESYQDLLDDFYVSAFNEYDLTKVKKILNQSPNLINLYNSNREHLINVLLKEYFINYKKNNSNELCGIILYCSSLEQLRFTNNDYSYLNELFSLYDINQRFYELKKIIIKNITKGSNIEYLFKISDMENFSEFILYDSNNKLSQIFNYLSKTIDKLNVSSDLEYYHFLLNINDYLRLFNKCDDINYSSVNSYLNKLQKKITHKINKIKGTDNSKRLRLFLQTLLNQLSKTKTIYNKRKVNKWTEKNNLINLSSIIFPKQLVTGILSPNSSNDIDLSFDPVITIDENNTENMEDALYIRENDNGTYTLYIHITNPVMLINNNRSIFEEAKKRGNCICLNGMCIRLIPESIIDNYFNLIPCMKRNVLSHIFTIDGYGNIINYTCQKSIIRVKYRLTYKEANNILVNGSNDYVLDEIIYSLSKVFNLIIEKNDITNWKSEMNGGFKTDNDDSNIKQMIAMSAIMVGKYVSNYLLDSGYPCIYRNNLDGKHSFYSDVNQGHLALSARCYSRVTSPTNRYGDLVNNKILQDYLFGHPTDKQYNELEELVREGANIMNEADKKIKALTKRNLHF